ncbi:alpha/beta hydrolase [Thalassotalea ganghwensis]
MKTKLLLKRFYTWHRNPPYFWLAFFLVYLPIFPFIVISIGVFIYIFWPLKSYEVDFELFNKEQLIVVAHGLKDTNQTWAQEIADLWRKKLPTAHVVTIDWHRYSNNAFTCAVNGERIGREIARQIKTNAVINKVRVIGHSCGAFINLGICEELRVNSHKKTTYTIESIYLDPVSVYGGLFWDYGIKHFGQCADSSVTYFDTEDSVPGSNKAPLNSKGIDVTSYKQALNYKGKAHQWPIYYYINELKH